MGVPLSKLRGGGRSRDEDFVEIEFGRGGIRLVNEKKFIWKVENFHVLSVNEKLLNSESYCFNIEPPGETPAALTRWRISLKAAEGEEETMAQVYLRLVEAKLAFCGPSLLCNVECNIEREDGSKCFKALGIKKIQDFGTGNGICIAELAIGGTRRFTKVGRSLTLTVKIQLYHRNQGSERKESGAIRPLRGSWEDWFFKLKALRQFAYLLENSDEHLADVKIISNEGQVFYAHKCVLMARSSVFNTMFSEGVGEFCDGRAVIEIGDVSGKAVDFLLHYLYNGEIGPYVVGNAEDDYPCISELISLSIKFGLDDLLEHFNFTLGTFCTESNVAFSLYLANKFRLKRAREIILKFVKDTQTDLFDA